MMSLKIAPRDDGFPFCPLQRSSQVLLTIETAGKPTHPLTHTHTQYPADLLLKDQGTCSKVTLQNWVSKFSPTA